MSKAGKTETADTPQALLEHHLKARKATERSSASTKAGARNAPPLVRSTRVTATAGRAGGSIERERGG